MALRKNLRRNQFAAKLVTESRIPCAFCRRDVDDELIYGKLYAIGDIQCHYFCVLLSSCLVQKGKDDQGLFGFLYQDILAEVERSKKHKCSYCGQEGATLGCAIGQCRKQFHLPCGRERSAVSLFYGNYKSFCNKHAPKQKISDEIMNKVKMRKLEANKKLKRIGHVAAHSQNEKLECECVCVICYEEVQAGPALHTFWPPCCARDAWLHRSCLQRMALSAGMHYLKCPLCNDKESFCQAVISQGYYIPDRDAAWELEQNAFAEMYERELRCTADECFCPSGRSFDAEEGAWDIITCLLCGGAGWHRSCAGDNIIGEGVDRDVCPAICAACKPAATEDLHVLAARIHAVIKSEREASQSQSRRAHAPRRVMPSRMSLRRTKQALASTSTGYMNTARIESKRSEVPQLQSSQDTLTSPTKLIEKEFKHRIHSLGVNLTWQEDILDKVRHKLRKPKPLSVKNKLIHELLDNMVDNALKETKHETIKCEEIVDISESPPPQEVKQEVMTSNTADELPSIQTDVTAEKHIAVNTEQCNTDLDMNTNIERADNDSEPDISVIKTEQLKMDIDIKVPTEDITENNNQLDVLSSDFNQDIHMKSATDEDTVQYMNKEILQEVIDVDSMEHWNTDMKTDTNGDTIKCNSNISNDDVIHVDYYMGQDRKENNQVRRNKRKHIKLDIDGAKKVKSQVSITKDNIKVRIKWKRERLKVQITENKRKLKRSNLRQYVLQYKGNKSIVKPDREVTPLKKKYMKQEKSPDKFVQTSIQNFLIAEKRKD